MTTATVCGRCPECGQARPPVRLLIKFNRAARRWELGYRRWDGTFLPLDVLPATEMGTSPEVLFDDQRVARWAADSLGVQQVFVHRRGSVWRIVAQQLS